MKMHMKAVVAAVALAAGGAAMAESTYGYNPSGGARTATARLNVTVNIPKLVLLRVGSSGATVDTATLNGAFSGIPGGVATPVDGSDLATGWNGTAPTMSDVSSSGVNVVAWTNGSGATLTGSLTTAFSETGMDAAVTVANSAALPGGALAHPGGALTFGGSTNITRNTVVGSTWTYSMTGAAMLGFPSGSYTAVATYTASAP